jgi:hypothetical protein
VKQLTRQFIPDFRKVIAGGHLKKVIPLRALFLGMAQVKRATE